MAALCLKVNHLIVDRNFKSYVEHFLNKPSEAEYYVDKATETEIGIDFLKTFKNYNLLKFIRLHMRYNLIMWKHSTNVWRTTVLELKVNFVVSASSFTINILRVTLVWRKKGMDVCVSNVSGFNCTEFMKMISINVHMDHLDTTNFQISQMSVVCACHIGSC